MAATPADIKAAFQNAIPFRRDEFARRVAKRLKSIVHEDQYTSRYPQEVLVLAEEELRQRIKLAADRVKQLINTGWTVDEMVTVRKIFLDCFGTFDSIEKDPQSDLYHAVEAAFDQVGQYNPAQATMNHRRLSEVQVTTATEYLSDLELYYAEHSQGGAPIIGTAEVTLGDATVVAQAVLSWESDAFISYASEDRAFVKQLAERLRSAKVRVWLDESELTVGDSLRGKIDASLRTSQYGIVVLSHSFFSKDWPQLELDGLLSIQTTSGRKVILPVWHGITKEEISKYSPILSGHLATKSADGIDRVVRDLLRVLRPNEESSPLDSSPHQAVTSFREQVLDYVKKTRALLLQYGPNPSTDEQEQILTAYIKMASETYYPIKHHLEKKLGYKRVEALSKLPLPMTRQAIARVADLLENLAMEVPEYLPPYPLELDALT